MATLGRPRGWGHTRRVSGLCQEGFVAAAPSRKVETRATSGGAWGCVRRGLDLGPHALPSLTPKRSSSTRRSPSKPPVWSRTTVDGPSRPSTFPGKERRGCGLGPGTGPDRCREGTEPPRPSPGSPVPFLRLSPTLALLLLLRLLVHM